MAFTEASSPGPGRAWRGGFLLGALCYTICIMKAPPQALEGPEEEPSWHVPFHGIYRSLLSRPFQGLERRLHGIPVLMLCAIQYAL